MLSASLLRAGKDHKHRLPLTLVAIVVIVKQTKSLNFARVLCIPLTVQKLVQFSYKRAIAHKKPLRLCYLGRHTGLIIPL